MAGREEYIVEIAKDSEYLGRMTDPTASACVTGVCGDEMEFYLVIEEGVIKETKFFTRGCLSTLICGHITCQLASGKSVKDALGISPNDVIERLYNVSEDHCHCSILAVSVLQRAIADYLLKK